MQIKKLPFKRKLFLQISVIVLCVAGFYVNLVGTLVWYQYGIMYGWDKEKLYNRTDNMEIMTWNPIYSPIILHTKALLSDFVSQIHPEKYLNTSWYWTSYGLAPCSYDDYIFCKIGLIPLVLLITMVTIVGVIILKEVDLLTLNSRCTGFYKVIKRTNLGKPSNKKI